MKGTNNVNGLTLSIFPDPRTGGKISKVGKMNIIFRIGPYKSTFLGGGPKGYVKYPNLFTPYLHHFQMGNARNIFFVTHATFYFICHIVCISLEQMFAIFLKIKNIKD